MVPVHDTFSPQYKKTLQFKNGVLACLRWNYIETKLSCYSFFDTCICSRARRMHFCVCSSSFWVHLSLRYWAKVIELLYFTFSLLQQEEFSLQLHPKHRYKTTHLPFRPFQHFNFQTKMFIYYFWGTKSIQNE